jgi:hypothetical protein
MENKENTFELRPYLKLELRAMYGVSWYVFRKMLKPFESELGQITGAYLTVNQVEIIFKHLGVPRKITVKD